MRLSRKLKNIFLGILDGHQTRAIANLRDYYSAFDNGDFRKMVSYLRNPPFEIEDL